MGITKKELHRNEINARKREAGRRRLNRLISSRSASSPMSNAKWRKAFCLLADPSLQVSSLRWKFLDSDHEAKTPVPQVTDIGDSHLRCGAFWPYEYREIEWLVVVTPDAPAVLDALTRLGRFDLELHGDDIRVYGYR